jgi:hypothetical protein
MLLSSVQKSSLALQTTNSPLPTPGAPFPAFFARKPALGLSKDGAFGSDFYEISLS